jgi:putative SOS response-associated peptidase YedK
MCGRYGLYSRKERLKELLGIDDGKAGGDLVTKYNIAPRTACWLALRRQGLDYKLTIESYEWGLLPYWVQDPKEHRRPINARTETVFDKPMFRESIRGRRCLVPADGYYEWRTTPTGKIPFWFTMARGEPFFFGGVWDTWHSGKVDQLPTFALLTTSPNELCAQVHDRMPVIIPASAYQLWVDPAVKDPNAIKPLLGAFPADQMRMREVSRAVNNSKSEGPELIEPVPSRS